MLGEDCFDGFVLGLDEFCCSGAGLIVGVGLGFGMGLLVGTGVRCGISEG